MVKRYVRVYVEGGAEGRPANSDFRRGWKTFLNELHELAREQGYVSLEVVRGKDRSNAFRRFTGHRTQYPNDLCVLLVDAETAVPEHTNVWNVVARRTGDHWRRPAWATENHLYLMVHFVETWLLADQDALQSFFGRNFNRRPLPRTNLEDRPKAEIQGALDRATRNSSKGPYRHGQAHEIIAIVNPDKVKGLYHGRRLFSSLSRLIRDEPGR
jgi:hypothetical protein